MTAAAVTFSAAESLFLQQRTCARTASHIACVHRHKQSRTTNDTHQFVLPKPLWSRFWKGGNLPHCICCLQPLYQKIVKNTQLQAVGTACPTNSDTRCALHTLAVPKQHRYRLGFCNCCACTVLCSPPSVVQIPSSTPVG
jgi:hypothetical protein